MKLLARILSHGFAIAVVLLLAVGLIYRGELFPEYNLPDFLDIGKLASKRDESAATQASEDVQVKDSVPASEESEGGATATVTPAPAVAEPEAVQQAAPGIETEAPTVTTGAGQEEEAGSGQAVSVPEDNGQQHGEELPEAAAPRMDESGTAAAADAGVVPGETPADMDAGASQAESGTAMLEATEAPEPLAKPQEKAYQLLADAREAYWLRDYDIAETKYLDLTRLEPDNPDGYGELGNMYFSQGQWDKAASAYYEAGVRLLHQGLTDQAEELVAVIRGLNGAHADDLEQKIKEARSAAD